MTLMVHGVRCVELQLCDPECATDFVLARQDAALDLSSADFAAAPAYAAAGTRLGADEMIRIAVTRQ